MSGGRFEYNQHKIGYIADDIEQEIINNGKAKTREQLKDEGWRDPDWYEKYPEDLNFYEYPKDVIDEFNNAVKSLRTSAIYAQRIDWLLSGDDGEESFLRRLKEELDKI